MYVSRKFPLVRGPWLPAGRRSTLPERLRLCMLVCMFFGGARAMRWSEGQGGRSAGSGGQMNEDTTGGNRRRSFWKMSQSNRRRGRSKLRYYRKSHCIVPRWLSVAVCAPQCTGTHQSPFTTACQPGEKRPGETERINGKCRPDNNDIRPSVLGCALLIPHLPSLPSPPSLSPHRRWSPPNQTTSGVTVQTDRQVGN